MIEDAGPLDRRIGEHFDVEAAGYRGQFQFGDIVRGPAGGGGFGDNGDADRAGGGGDVEEVVEVVDAVNGAGGLADGGLAVAPFRRLAGDDARWWCGMRGYGWWVIVVALIGLKRKADVSTVL